MQNPTLINGFEDVLTFISQQAERIKRLEEEKATLVRENVELGEELDQYKEELFEAHHQYDLLKEKNQQQVDEIEGIAARRPHKTDFYRRLQKEIKQLETEKNDLQEEIKKLDRSKTGVFKKQRDKAWEEIKDLKERLQTLENLTNKI